jgi:hypothetical protein
MAVANFVAATNGGRSSFANQFRRLLPDVKYENRRHVRLCWQIWRTDNTQEWALLESFERSLLFTETDESTVALLTEIGWNLVQVQWTQFNQCFVKTPNQSDCDKRADTVVKTLRALANRLHRYFFEMLVRFQLYRIRMSATFFDYDRSQFPSFPLNNNILSFEINATRKLIGLAESELEPISPSLCSDLILLGLYWHDTDIALSYRYLKEAFDELSTVGSNFQAFDTMQRSLQGIESRKTLCCLMHLLLFLVIKGIQRFPIEPFMEGFRMQIKLLDLEQRRLTALYSLVTAHVAYCGNLPTSSEKINVLTSCAKLLEDLSAPTSIQYASANEIGPSLTYIYQLLASLDESNEKTYNEKVTKLLEQYPMQEVSCED